MSKVPDEIRKALAGGKSLSSREISDATGFAQETCAKHLREMPDVEIESVERTKGVNRPFYRMRGATKREISPLTKLIIAWSSPDRQGISV